MLKKRKWQIIAAAVLAVFIGMWFMNSRNSVSVKTAEAVVGRISPSVSVSGEIKGFEADLSPKMPSLITWVGVKEGDWVSAGSVLVKFDNYDNAWSDYERIKTLYDGGFATKQQYETARLQYENSYLASPISGKVVLVAQDPGETASPGVTAVSVVDPASKYIEVQIDETDIGEVKLGNDAQITSDAFPDLAINGRLSNIVNRAELKKVGGRIKMDEEDKIFRGRIAFDDPEKRLKIGMSVNAEIITGIREGLLIIPREAVFSKNDKQKVYVVLGKKAKERDVELGIKDYTNIEVVKGLKAGEKVAVSSLDKIKDGSRVKIEK